MGGGECGAHGGLAGARPRRPAHGEVARGGDGGARFRCSGEWEGALATTRSASDSWGAEEAFRVEEIQRKELGWWLTLGSVHGGRRRRRWPGTFDSGTLMDKGQ